MRVNFFLIVLILFVSCDQTYNKDTEETQFLNDFIEDDTSVEKTPLRTIKINTDAGKEIVDEPKISSKMIISKDSMILYDGNIGIEYLIFNSRV